MTAENQPDDNQISVSRVIEAPARDIFNLLIHPARHREADATGTIVSADGDPLLLAVGDRFTMNMHHESQGGDYRMENRVVSYVGDEMIAWAPSREGDEPGGWKWAYMLDDLGSSTRVTLTYDWAAVQDPELARIFPAFGEEVLKSSLDQLAAAFA